MKKVIKDTLHANGIDIGIYTQDFENEFEGFKKQAGANAFTMSPKKWIEATAAIGIVSKAGRYGGTYAHSDIAMSFATWISPGFLNDHSGQFAWTPFDCRESFSSVLCTHKNDARDGVR